MIRLFKSNILETAAQIKSDIKQYHRMFGITKLIKSILINTTVIFMTYLILLVRAIKEKLMSKRALRRKNRRPRARSKKHNRKKSNYGRR